jgi:hypothetical protein
MPSMLPLLYSTEPFEFSGLGFDPKTTVIIRQVFDKAHKEIHDEGQPTPSTKTMLADRLIEIAAHGERAPDEPCEAALVSLGLEPNRFTIAPGPSDAIRPGRGPDSRPTSTKSG